MNFKILLSSPLSRNDIEKTKETINSYYSLAEICARQPLTPCYIQFRACNCAQQTNW